MKSFSGKYLSIFIASVLTLSTTGTRRALAQAATEGPGEISAEESNAAMPDMTMAVPSDQAFALNFSGPGSLNADLIQNDAAHAELGPGFRRGDFHASVIPTQTKSVIASETKSVIPAEAGIQGNDAREKLDPGFRRGDGYIIRAMNAKELTDQSYGFRADTPALPLEDRTLSAVAANRPDGAVSQLENVLNGFSWPSRQARARRRPRDGTPAHSHHYGPLTEGRVDKTFNRWFKYPKLTALMKITRKINGNHAVVTHPPTAAALNKALDAARRTDGGRAMIPWSGHFAKYKQPSHLAQFFSVFTGYIGRIRIPYKTYVKFLAEGFNPVTEEYFSHDLADHGIGVLFIPPGVWAAVRQRAQALYAASRLGALDAGFKRALEAEIERFVDAYDRLTSALSQDYYEANAETISKTVGPEAGSLHSVFEKLKASSRLSAGRRAALESIINRFSNADLSDAQIREQVRIVQRAQRLAQGGSR